MGLGRGIPQYDEPQAWTGETMDPTRKLAHADVAGTLQAD
jgi:hypothetical protein